MTLDEFCKECDRREKYLDEKLTNLERAIDGLKATMETMAPAQPERREHGRI